MVTAGFLYLLVTAVLLECYQICLRTAWQTIVYYYKKTMQPFRFLGSVILHYCHVQSFSHTVSNSRMCWLYSLLVQRHDPISCGNFPCAFYTLSLGSGSCQSSDKREQRVPGASWWKNWKSFKLFSVLFFTVLWSGLGLCTHIHMILGWFITA